jgi:hypothetical protein
MGSARISPDSAEAFTFFGSPMNRFQALTLFSTFAVVLTFAALRLLTF